MNPPDTPLRIVFFGTPEFAVPSLRALLAGPDRVVGVVCQPDKPAGRGRHLAAPPVKQAAVEAGIPLLQPAKVRTPEFAAALRAWEPTLIVVAAYGRILPQAVLDLPPLGCINVHASLLPKYRGAAPIQWAILRGEESTGVTIMNMTAELDAGDMLLRRATPIGPDETYGELQERLAVLGAEALTEALRQLREGRLVGQPQCATEMTLAPPVAKEDGRIDWTRSAAQIARAVRAFNPWPSAFTHLDGMLLKIHRARAAADVVADPPGCVTATGEDIVVATGEGALHVRELQLEGRKRLLAADFCRGGAVRTGTVLG